LNVGDPLDFGAFGLALRDEDVAGAHDLGAAIYECRDAGKVLDAILYQARAFAHAEAGSLYLAQEDSLKFVAVQKDKLDVALDILDKDTGNHFDPAVVGAFMGVFEQVLETYPALKAS